MVSCFETLQQRGTRGDRTREMLMASEAKEAGVSSCCLALNMLR